jgi:hypothetical protein
VQQTGGSLRFDNRSAGNSRHSPADKYRNAHAVSKENIDRSAGLLTKVTGST